jgi:hypothetical protein
MIRAAALWLHFVEVERPEVADFCRMVVPEPAVRQIIGKSIENVGRTVNIDPYATLAIGCYRNRKKIVPISTKAAEAAPRRLLGPPR